MSYIVLPLLAERDEFFVVIVKLWLAEWCIRDVQHNLVTLTTVVFCRAKRQYLLTCKVSKYSLLALHNRVEMDSSINTRMKARRRNKCMRYENTARQIPSNRTRWPTLVYCWPTVYDVGPTVNQRWTNVSCLLGM